MLGMFGLKSTAGFVLAHVKKWLLLVNIGSIS